jgi:serine protease Do
VQGVSPGGPADKAGLRPGDHRERFQDNAYVVGGDVIVSAGGHPVREEDDVAKALVQLAPGTQVDLVVLRDGKRKTLRVKLGERPLDTPRAG